MLVCEGHGEVRDNLLESVLSFLLLCGSGGSNSGRFSLGYLNGPQWSHLLLEPLAHWPGWPGVPRDTGASRAGTWICP